jgi:1-acyl-sn-glycerol-3-phosphate acyltransferase
MKLSNWPALSRSEKQAAGEMREMRRGSARIAARAGASAEGVAAPIVPVVVGADQLVQDAAEDTPLDWPLHSVPD